MKQKIEYKFFTILEYEKEAQYLREMHKKGYKLNCVDFQMRYVFDECEKEDVIYALDYQNDVTYDSLEYLTMYQDLGWELIQISFGFVYFRKPVKDMTNDETIFSDDESKKEMLKRVFVGRGIGVITTFMLVVLPNLIRNIVEGNVFFSAIFAMFLVIDIPLFIKFYKTYKNFK